MQGTNIYTHTYRHAYIYTHIYTHMCVYMYTHIYEYIYTWIYTHIYTHIYGYVCVYVYIYMCVYIHVYIYTHMHIHIHTRTYIDFKLCRSTWKTSYTCIILKAFHPTVRIQFFTISISPFYCYLSPTSVINSILGNTLYILPVKTFPFNESLTKKKKDSLGYMFAIQDANY